MIRNFKPLGLLLVLMLASVPAPADDIGDSKQILCTIVLATRCLNDGECKSGPPWKWNIPQFIEVDLAKRELRTTKASGENRATAIKNIVREDGQIFLQGVDNARAFSIAITRDTGMASFAVARPGLTVAAFGACTPIESRR